MLLGYLNEKGKLNLKRFQKFMENLANFDYDQFRDTYADIKFLEGKRTALIEATSKVCIFCILNLNSIQLIINNYKTYF